MPDNSIIVIVADNTSSPKTFSLYATNTNGTSSKIISNGTLMVVKNSSTSCLAILNAGDSTGSGIYLIKPASNPIAVYCDMNTDGGGWTRINNNISSSTTLFNSSDTLLTNDVPGSCGTPGCAFTINNISVVHTNVKINLTRTTSIIQCASLVGVSATTSYWNGATWIYLGMCNWSDGVFANATATDMTGLKMLWKLEGPKAGNGEIKFISQCSGSDDSGQIQVTAWVK